MKNTAFVYKENFAAAADEACRICRSSEYCVAAWKGVMLFHFLIYPCCFLCGMNGTGPLGSGTVPYLTAAFLFSSATVFDGLKQFDAVPSCYADLQMPPEECTDYLHCRFRNIPFFLMGIGLICQTAMQIAAMFFCSPAGVPPFVPLFYLALPQTASCLLAASCLVLCRRGMGECGRMSGYCGKIRHIICSDMEMLDRILSDNGSTCFAIGHDVLCVDGDGNISTVKPDFQLDIRLYCGDLPSSQYGYISKSGLHHNPKRSLDMFFEQA